MPIPPNNLDISQEAWERLLLQQHWLEARPEFLAVRAQHMLQLLLAQGTSSDDTIGVIRQFSLLIDQGITPPAHILGAVAMAFREYVKAEIPPTLDVAFNLKPKQRVGHPLTHRKGREERWRIVFQMWCLRHAARLNGEMLSIEDAAGQVINQLDQTELSEDVLKKDYIKIKADEIFDRAINILEEI